VEREDGTNLDYIPMNPDFGSLMLSNVLEDMGESTKEDVLEKPLHTVGNFTRDATSLFKKVREGALLAPC
jgi:hypothetical protein